VVFAGLTLENAAQETREVGSGQHKRIERKYTVQKLLDPEFRLPRESSESKDAKAAMKALTGKGVRVFKAKKE